MLFACLLFDVDLHRTLLLHDELCAGPAGRVRMLASSQQALTSSTLHRTEGKLAGSRFNSLRLIYVTCMCALIDFSFYFAF